MKEEIDALVQKIVDNPNAIGEHSVIILANYEGVGCIAAGTQMGISKLILGTMARDGAFANSVIACAEVFKQDCHRILEEMAAEAKS